MQQNTASLSKILNFALCTRSWYAFLVCYTWRRWSIFARNWVLANTLHLTRILGVFHMDSCPLYVWPTTLCMLLLHGSYPPNMVSFPEMINMLNLDILYEVKGRSICQYGRRRPTTSGFTVGIIFVKIHMGDLYKKLSSKREFWENRPSNSHTWLEDVTNVFPYFPHYLLIWVKFGIIDLHALPLSETQFRVNRWSESHTSHRARKLIYIRTSHIYFTI